MMTMMTRGWRQRAWLSGTVACVVSLGSAVAQAGISGGDSFAVMAGISGGDSDNLDVVGVVESTNSSGVAVSGQTVRLSAGTKVTAESRGSLAKGALVAVYGTINSDGTIAASAVNVLASEYVAGATTLYVRGVVKSVNPALATAKVGNLSIDYSSSLASGSSSIAAGSVVEFSGLQTSSSTLYASKSKVVKADGISGGDDKMVAAGISGGDDKLMKAAGISGGDSKLMVAAGISGGDDKLMVAAGISGGDSKLMVAAGISGGDSKLMKAAGISGGDQD